MKDKKQIRIKFNFVSVLLMFPLLFMLFRHISRRDTYEPIAIFGAASLFLMGMIITAVNSEL